MADNDTSVVLQDILATLKSLKQDHSQLATTVDAISGRVNALAGVKQAQEGFARDASSPMLKAQPQSPRSSPQPARGDASRESISSLNGSGSTLNGSPAPTERRASTTKKITLTSYPGQAAVDPLPMEWGAKDPAVRGPIVVSRNDSTIRRRNALGAHGGSYSIYYALAVASHAIDTTHKADYTNCEPAEDIGPFKSWSDPKKIVAMDPWGHLAPWLFKSVSDSEHIDIKPTIAITRAHMKIPELADSVKQGRLVPDGKICLNDSGELKVTKFAVEPVWYLPGVAERFNVSEGDLRRSLFESTGGSYPELITRPDIKIFLPPIGGLTVYCFGDVAKMSDPNVKLSLRVHDECNGSDVFGSDICTCRPYLIFGIEECVKEAQRGGSGVVIYFRKEGRALGEVTKYLVYNARKRGSDKASEYFKRTENIAGVKDMRFQALMPDVLHWLGITKIDRMMSMSDMKHDAIVGQGIPIHERVEIPSWMVPEDSRVEIDAKIYAGYYAGSNKILTMEELEKVSGQRPTTNTKKLSKRTRDVENEDIDDLRTSSPPPKREIKRQKVQQAISEDSDPDIEPGGNASEVKWLKQSDGVLNDPDILTFDGSNITSRKEWVCPMCFPTRHYHGDANSGPIRRCENEHGTEHSYRAFVRAFILDAAIGFGWPLTPAAFKEGVKAFGRSKAATMKVGRKLQVAEPSRKKDGKSAFNERGFGDAGKIQVRRAMFFDSDWKRQQLVPWVHGKLKKLDSSAE